MSNKRHVPLNSEVTLGWASEAILQEDTEGTCSHPLA